MKQGHEIKCPGCGGRTLLKREPVYDGFRKVGEALSCFACGRRFESEDEVPFVGQTGPSIFAAADRPRRPDVFDRSEAPAICRHCTRYVVNPFVQRCSLHHREVAATDTCRDFERKPVKEDDDDTA
jgi:DNA-directed RNA polymerase subunit RPC12/RpoP